MKKLKINTGLVIAMTLGLLIRLWRLGNNDVWFDEAFTVYDIRKGTFYNNAPLYYFFMKIWLWGGSASQSIVKFYEYFLRLPSAIFSFLAIPAVYILAKAIFNKKTALAAAFFMVFSPFQIWYAQEARHYSLAVLLTAVNSLFFISWLKHRLKKHLVLFILSSILSIYTHYFAIFLLASQALYLVIFEKNKKRMFFLLIPAVSFLPWLPVFKKIFYFLKDGFWPQKPEIGSFLITVKNMLLGYTSTTSGYALGITIAAIAVFYAIKLGKQNKKEKLGVIFCLVNLICPILAAYLFSNTVFPLYIDRNFLIISPFLFILIASGISKIKPRPFGWLFVALLISIEFSSDLCYFNNKIYLPENTKYHSGSYIKKPVKPLVNFLTGNVKKEDYIVFSHLGAMLPVSFYLHLYNQSPLRSQTIYAYDPGIVDTAWQRPYQEIFKHDDLFKPKGEISGITGREGRVFFIGGDWKRDGTLDDNSKSIKDYFDSRLRIQRAIDFEGIKLYVYGR